MIFYAEKSEKEEKTRRLLRIKPGACGESNAENL
jgi:hypothetical protein